MASRDIERGFNSIASLKRAFLDHSCEQVLVKILSRNQDNEKNQVYLGPDDHLLSLLPGTVTFQSESKSTAKRHSRLGVGKETLNLDFSWLFSDGSTSRAPNAKIIYYFQYPEIRFSGFLLGCSRSPRAIRRDEQDEYGRRALLLAVRGQEVLGVIVSDQDGPGLIDELEALEPLPGQALLRVLPLPSVSTSTDLERLVGEIHEVAGTWHPAMILKANALRPELQRHLQGSGWTLEALLGIARNAVKGPDKYGYELKVLPKAGPVSLITTEPDFGYRSERGLTEFLHTYGWKGTRDDGSWRFNGKHQYGRAYRKSGALLVIANWDPTINGPNGDGPPTVMLVSEENNAVLAGWSFESLSLKWNKKHSGCVYVDYSRWPRTGGIATDYRYGPEVHCGSGTSINHLLRALVNGVVYLDPGDRVHADGEEKHRMQWRSNGTVRHPLRVKLGELYSAWEHRVVTMPGDEQFRPT